MTEPLINGRYALVEELARGGMGRVIKARDVHLERELAIKTILPGTGELARARFTEEAQITGQLRHPNIIPVHELGATPGPEGDELYLVMKLVKGRDLRQLVKAIKEDEDRTRDDYPLRRLLRVFLKVCGAIAFAHDHGVIHRDLKPANVMIGANDEVLVMDWGVAKPLDRELSTEMQLDPDTLEARRLAAAKERGDVSGSGSRPGASSTGRPVVSGLRASEEGADLTQAGLVVGTPAYMAPEQADGTDVDERADVYALGAILYEVTTHRPPYRGSSLEALSALMRHAPPAPSEAAPNNDIPPPVESIILKAMDRERAGRYPNAAAIAADVEAYLDGRSVEAHDERPLEVFRRMAATHRTAAVTTLAAVIVINVLAVVSAVLIWRERSAAEERARDAQAAADAATAATELIRTVERGVRVTTEAADIANGFAEEAAKVLPLEAVPDDPRPTLAQLHDDAIRRVLDRRTAVERLRAEAPGDGADSPFDPLLAEIDQARGRISLLALEALLSRVPSRALSLLDAIDVDEADAAIVRARAHLRLGQRRQAARSLAPALEAPDRSSARIVAEALRSVIAEESPASRRGAIDAAIRATPGEAWLYLRRAEARALLGDEEGAREDYDQATAIRPLDGWVHSSRLLHTYTINQQELPSSLGVVDRLSPENLDWRLFEARCMMWRNHDRERLNALVADYEKLAPITAYRHGAETMLIGPIPDEAESYARRVLKIDPDDRVGLGCLAEVHLLRGELDEADAIARRGLAAFPDDPRLSSVLGQIHVAAGRHIEAAPHLETAARAARTPDPWRRLAECLLVHEDPNAWARGVDAMRRGQAFDLFALFYYHQSSLPVPGDPRNHRVLGHLRRRQGKLGQAAIHYVRAFNCARGKFAKRVLGDDRQDLLHAGDVHRELGLVQEAGSFYAMAAEDPKHAAAADQRLQEMGLSRRPR